MMGQAIGCFAGDDNGENKPAYVIPNSANVVAHVNANDLQNGTAQYGHVWTINGSLSSSAQSVFGGRNMIGPFTDSNFLSNIAGLFSMSQPHTIAMVMTAIDMTNIPVVLSYVGAVGGFFVEAFGPTGPNNIVVAYGGGSSELTSPANALNVGSGINILSFGADTLGNVFINLNGSTASNTGVLAQVPTGAWNMGRYVGGSSYGYNGLIGELYISTDVPSNTSLQTLYTTILGNI